MTLFCTHASAQVIPAQSPEAEVVVKSTSILPSSIENLPGSYSVLTQAQIEARAPFSIVETIREIPGLHVVAEDVAGTHLNIGMRGLNPRRSSRTLLLEDGAPTVFFAPYADPSSHYSTPLERIERVEVLKGSGQILYGPQTMGGMINFVTRSVPTQGVTGSVKVTAGQQAYQGAHFNLGTGTDQGGVMLDVLKKRGDGIRAEHHFDVQDVALKAQFKINNEQRITGKFAAFKENSLFSETGLTAAEYTASRYKGNFDQAEDAMERFTMDRQTAQLVHEWDLNKNTKFSTQLYHSKIDRQSQRSRDFEEDDGMYGMSRDEYAIRPRQYEFFGIEPKLEIKHKAFGLKNQAILGFRYHAEKIDRRKFEGDAFNDTTQADERLSAKIKAISYYAQNTFISGDWTITPGLRLEDVTSRKNLYSSATGAAFDVLENNLTTSKLQALPGLGWTWNGLNDTTVFGGIHRGFAPPRPDRDIDDNTLQKVMPELSTTTELGVRTGLLKSGHLEATVFNMDISDIVVQSGGVFRNEGRAKHTGFEISGKLNLGELAGQKNHYFASLAYTHLMTAKFKDSGQVGGEGEDGYGSYQAGNRLPYAPKHALAMNLSYEGPQGLQARVGVTYVSRQFANTDNYRGTSAEGHCGDVGGDGQTDCGLFGEIPSLTLFNASVSYAPKGQKVSYFLSGENLANKKYFTSRTNGLQAGRGRTVVAGLRYAF
jgi:Fe(3+) dicitrate transport protein